MEYRYQYQASEPDVREAVAELLALGTTGDGAQPLVGFHLAPGSRFGIIARRTELAVFSEAFNSTRDSLSQEYAPYEDVSGFFVVIDTSTGLPAGAMRYVDGGIDLNPTLRDLDEIGTLPAVAAEMRELLEYHPDAWDIDSYEVHEAYRGHHGGYRTTGLLGRMLVVAAGERRVPGLSLVASQHAHRTQQVLGFPERLLSDEPLVYPDGVSMLVAWVDIAKAESSMLDHLAGLRAMADDPAVARELSVVEPFILGMATGEGYDEFIDMTPR